MTPRSLPRLSLGIVTGRLSRSPVPSATVHHGLWNNVPARFRNPLYPPGHYTGARGPGTCQPDTHDPTAYLAAPEAHL